MQRRARTGLETSMFDLESIALPIFSIFFLHLARATDSVNLNRAKLLSASTHYCI